MSAPLEPEVATELLRRLVDDSSRVKYNRFNDPNLIKTISQGDILQACLCGRVIGNNGVSTRSDLYKYIVRSKSLQEDGRFIELEIIMDSKAFLLKILSCRLV